VGASPEVGHAIEDTLRPELRHAAGRLRSLRSFGFPKFQQASTISFFGLLWFLDDTERQT